MGVDNVVGSGIILWLTRRSWWSRELLAVECAIFERFNIHHNINLFSSLEGCIFLAAGLWVVTAIKRALRQIVPSEVLAHVAPANAQP